MISNFRDFAKSKWAVALLALLIISFAVVGRSQTDVFKSLGDTYKSSREKAGTARAEKYQYDTFYKPNSWYAQGGGGW